MLVCELAAIILKLNATILMKFSEIIIHPPPFWVRNDVAALGPNEGAQRKSIKMAHIDKTIIKMCVT